jgi:hypothetical protein
VPGGFLPASMGSGERGVDDLGPALKRAAWCVCLRLLSLACHRGLIARRPALAGSMKSSMTDFGSWSAATAPGCGCWLVAGMIGLTDFRWLHRLQAPCGSGPSWVDGEAVACDRDGLPSFDRLRYRRGDGTVFLFAFDLLELNGDDLRREPLEVRKRELSRLLRWAAEIGLQLNEHIAEPGDIVFRHACKLGLEASCRSASAHATVRGARPTGSRWRTRTRRRWGATRKRTGEEKCAGADMGQLILKRASASPPSGQWQDDEYDVLAEGIVVGRIRATIAPVESPWFWTLAYGYHHDRRPTHGYAATGEAAMAAFAKSWRRE